jgi:hypothetical protein
MKRRLTWQGHDFLDSVRDPKVWAKSNMDSLHRLSQHLPRLRSISVDTSCSTAWVMGDPIQLIILKGHLLVEAELVDICSRLLANPAALGKVTFLALLNLVRALIDDGEVTEAIWQALGDLNKIRNMLAHNLVPKDIESELQRFLRRFDEFDHKEEPLPSRLISYFFFLCGALSGIGKPVTTQTESDGA